MDNAFEIAQVLERAFKEWRIRQIRQDKDQISLSKFAEFIGKSQGLTSQWLSGARTPSRSSLISITPKLAELLGPEVYDQLGLARPEPHKEEPADPVLRFVTNNWENLSPEAKKRIRDIVERHQEQKGVNPRHSQAEP